MIVVVDDFPTDQTADMIFSFPVRTPENNMTKSVFFLDMEYQTLLNHQLSRIASYQNRIKFWENLVFDITWNIIWAQRYAAACLNVQTKKSSQSERINVPLVSPVFNSQNKAQSTFTLTHPSLGFFWLHIGDSRCLLYLTQQIHCPSWQGCNKRYTKQNLIILRKK